MTHASLDTRILSDSASDLKGKRVLITGASRGLGQSCAEAFAKAGAKLLLAGRAADRLAHIHATLERAEEHRVVAGDLTTLEAMDQLISAAEAYGEIEVILHVMGGGLGRRDPLLTWEDFALLFKTNLAAGAEINRRLIPRMIERHAGNIVHVGSIASTEAVGSVGYNTVKAALAAYIRSLGRTLAPTGVIITGILPGGFMAPENSMARLQQRDPQLLERWIAEHEPRKRLGQPEELMPLLMLLASRQATMMSGCCVPIDAGEGLAYIL